MGAFGPSYVAERLAVPFSEKVVVPGGIVYATAASLEELCLYIVTFGSVKTIECCIYPSITSDSGDKSMGGRLSHLLDSKGYLADLTDISLSRRSFLIDFLGSAYPSDVIRRLVGMLAVVNSC